MSAQRETVGAVLSHGAGVTGPYRLQFKAPGMLEQPPAAPAAPAGQDAELPTDDERVAGHEWAGDLYEDAEGVSEPSEAFAHLRGQDGSEAWLDRAEDGTLTAWVRDTDGSVYRYSDPDSWAQDVDAAGMARVASNLDDGQDETEDPAAGDPAADPVADPNADPSADPSVDPEADPAAEVDPSADPEADLDPAVDPEADPTADPAAPEVDPEVDPTLDPAAADGDLQEDPAALNQTDAPVDGQDETDPAAADAEDPEDATDGGADEDQEDEEGNPFAKKKKLQGKSVPAATGGFRFKIGAR